MARPRVLLASRDAEVAVQMISALNPRRYRVEHVFDLSEALLRAELVLAHAVVVHAEKRSEELVRRCSRSGQRLSLVFVSGDPAVRNVAAQLTARFLRLPFTVPDFKTAVYHAVQDTKQERAEQRARPSRTTPAEKPRVLLVTRETGHGEVIAAVLRKELQVTAEVVGGVDDAVEQLGRGIGCLVADPELLMTDPSGPEVARTLAREGVALVPLRSLDDLDMSSAGQLAWDLVPQVRRSLSARASRAAS